MLVDNARITRLRHDKWTDGWLVAFTCDGSSADFIATVTALKERLPQRCRRFVPQEHAWWVDDAWLGELEGLFSNFAEARAAVAAEEENAAREEEAREERRRRQESQSRSRSRAQSHPFSGSAAGATGTTASAGVPSEVRHAFAALYLTPDAPPEVVRAAYRTCAARHHPDHGGDTAAMQHINLAHEVASAWAISHHSTDTRR
jgi:hypothetical protein